MGCASFEWGNCGAMLLLVTLVTYHLSVLPGYSNVEALSGQTDLTLILLSLFFCCPTVSFHFFFSAPKPNYTETNTLIYKITFSCFICSSAIEATKLNSILQ